MTLKIDQASLSKMEAQHPGISESIRIREEIVLPPLLTPTEN